MTAPVLLGFVAACVLLAVTPGPNMALIIANTVSGGLRDGLTTLAGCLTGLSILVLAATAGMTSVMALMSEWFDVIRWVGALYLILLGIIQIRQYQSRKFERIDELTRSDSKNDRVVVGHDAPVLKSMSIESETRALVGNRWLYPQGLVVSLSNPKVILFLGALFPQFIVPSAPPGPQLAVLGVAFILTLAAVDLCYTLAIAKARSAFDVRRLQVLNVVSGSLLLAGGLVLATMRRP